MDFERGCKVCLRVAVWALIIGTAIHLRTAGLFRDLDEQVDCNPDVPKQMRMLWCYLNDDHSARWGGNPFYDGYPYGLNRVDEGIIRVVRPVCLAIRQHLCLGAEATDSPSSAQLYYWARCLRVLYGMALIIAAYFAAKALQFPWWARMLTCLMLAVAPLSITVSHMASGDIGPDIFSAAVLLCMGLYAGTERSKMLLVLTGIMLAFSFASKYQGLLVAWVPLSYLLLSDGPFKRKYSHLLGHCFLLILSFVLGVVVANPLFLVAPTQTWREMIANIAFIKNYHVSSEFLAKPLLSRAFDVLHYNVPLVFGALGWSVVILAAVGLAACSATALRKKSDLREDRILMLSLAVFSFPFVAIIVSLVDKPVVQPFHFSYLQLPLCLSMVYGLSVICRSTIRFKRTLSVCLALIALVELGNGALYDGFFWKHEDTKTISDVMSQDFVYSNCGSRKNRDVIRTLELESGNVAVFRNRPQDVSLQDGSFWNAVHIAPVPTVPFPKNYYWIFAHGPVLPRNDRMFVVRGNSSVEKGVVTYEEPSDLRIGVRSGFLPAEITLQSGRHKQELRLTPDTQQVVNLGAPSYRLVMGRPLLSHNIYISPIKLTVSCGDVWVTLLPNEREEANFLMFGGTDFPSPSFNVPPEYSIDEIVRQVQQARYLEGCFAGQSIAAGDSCEIFRCALPAGAYLIECDVEPRSPNTQVRIVLKDLFEFELFALSGDTTNTFPVTEHTVIKTRMEKTFAPYQFTVNLACETGSCMPGQWRIRPDTETIVNDLASYTNSNSRPRWLQHHSATVRPPSDPRFRGVLFDEAVELCDIGFPDTVRHGSNELFCAVRLLDFDLRQLHKYGVFVHFLDATGKQIFASNHILHQAVSAESNGSLTPFLLPDDLSAGEYDVFMGIYNTSTGRRMEIAVPPGSGLKVDAYRRLLVHHVTLK